ncbi:hypothetical protein MKleb_5837 (plasmid) [Klebsiella sp. PL-2018]|nr:hypothetical protein MKleb_5837 [Klebsiella sp. PL-2018]
MTTTVLFLSTAAATTKKLLAPGLVADNGQGDIDPASPDNLRYDENPERDIENK